MPDYGPNDPWANSTPRDAYQSRPDKTSKDYKQTSYWLDILLQGSNDAPDEEFEVDTDTSFPVLSTTTSSNSAKPRTLKAGYDFKNEKLIVVFRDGTWWEYRGVPEFMWYDFLAAESKGRFLRESGLDQWGNMGPADVTDMPKHRRVQMANMKEYADTMYLGKKE